MAEYKCKYELGDVVVTSRGLAFVVTDIKFSRLSDGTLYPLYTGDNLSNWKDEDDIVESFKRTTVK